MKYLAFLWAWILAFLALLAATVKILAYGWIAALTALLRKLLDFLRRWRARAQLPGRAGRTSDAPCVQLPPGAVKHPDPLIYSQYDLMNRGYAVTWDNPDIEVRRGGATVPSGHLDPGTEYEIVARISNNSTDAVVPGLPVIFSYISFGVGIKINPIGATSVFLGVKGGPNHPAFASVRWTTPPIAGHYCLLVFLAAVDDSNYNNNLGQENVVVGKATSPAEFTFQLRNAAAARRQFRFEVDTYAIPPLRPCGERGTQPPTRVVGSAGRAVPAEHDRRNYPVPAGWAVEINPAQPLLAAEAEITVHVRITPPAGFAGRLPFNVNVFDALGFTGGVTLYVEAP